MKYLLILFVGCFLDFGKGLSNLANSKCEYSIDKHIFQQEWSHGTYDLSQFLDNLKEQESLLLAEECKLRTYAFTEFSDLVYSRICNRTEFEEKCIADIRQAVQNQCKNSIKRESWNATLQKIDFLLLRDEELRKPCLQVAMLDRSPGAAYQEVRSVAPFCSPIWCGFTEEIFNKTHVSLWTCMPRRYLN